VHHLFYESLCLLGMLGLGDKETIRFSPHEHAYEEICSPEKIYRRIR
jgi:chemotaxis protein methyltransferase CheR